MTGLGKGLDALFGAVPQEEQMAENDVLKKFKNKMKQSQIEINQEKNLTKTNQRNWQAR